MQTTVNLLLPTAVHLLKSHVSRLFPFSNKKSEVQRRKKERKGEKREKKSEVQRLHTRKLEFELSMALKSEQLYLAKI